LKYIACAMYILTNRSRERSMPGNESQHHN
jgi:hypothetical protein